MVNVSVIIPVYNEIRFIQKTLESVIGEADEIILSDNASTDGTSDICQSFADKYQEIKYTRHKENMGMHKNNLFAINQVSGKYIRNIGAHDMISIGSNQSMASLLDKNHDVVMIYPKYVIALNNDYSFKYFHVYNEYKDALLSDSASVRVKSMITNLCEFSIFFGLWRTDIFHDVIRPRIFQSICTDHTILSSTAIRGKMLADERSIFFRMFPRDDETLDMEKDRHKNMQFPVFSKYSNLSYWQFALIAEQYEMLLENFKENDVFSKRMLDFLTSSFLHCFKGTDLTLDGMPLIIPGKESFCQNVLTFIKQVYNEQQRERKSKRKVAIIKGIKVIIKYILPYGIYKIPQLIYKSLNKKRIEEKI